jgi:beta-galactosidase
VAWEVKQAYCPIQIEEVKQSNPWVLDGEPGRLLIRNRTHTTPTSAFQAKYALRENGHVVETGAFPLPALNAGEQAETRFIQQFPRKADASYHVDISIHLAEATAYADAAFELGCFQFQLMAGDGACGGFEVPAIAHGGDRQVIDAADTTGEPAAVRAPLTLTETETAYTITGNGLVAVFSKTTGRLATLSRHGVCYVEDGPILCFTRPQSGIDAIPGWGRDKIWHAYDETAMTIVPTHMQASLIGTDRVLVESLLSCRSSAFPQPICVTLAQTLAADGSLTVDATHHMDESLGDLPRVGMELVLPEGFEAFRYFGRGPGENYRDRLLSARLGVFESTIAAEHFPFIPPSENGGHEQTRWISFQNGNGATLEVRADIPFHFDVHHSPIQAYRAAGHDHELARHPQSWLHIDAAHAGIGSDLGWSTFLTDADQVKATTRNQRFVLRTGSAAGGV